MAPSVRSGMLKVFKIILSPLRYSDSYLINEETNNVFAKRYLP